MKKFRMPGEWFRHDRTWMVWPYRLDNWKKNARPAQHAYMAVALAIAEFEPVTMCVSHAQLDLAKSTLLTVQSNMKDIGIQEFAKRLDFVIMATNDAWIRDTGPTFVHTEDNGLLGIDWKFNAWGEIYSDYSHDAMVARNVCQLIDTPHLSIDFVLEGGSIHVDGEGTILTTEECLLHPNRNPHLTNAQIEENLLQYLGGDKVLWLPHGLVADEDTNGHIDNFCCFARPGEVLLAWTENQDDPQFSRSTQAYEILANSTDARGRHLKITKVPIPTPIFYTPDDLDTLNGCVDGREAGERLAGSYINFYLCNGGVIVPQFGVPEDSVALQILQQVFPERKVRGVYSKDILLGGGNIHCITQQQPCKSM
ncbi:agmatine deiminase [archaeon]|nr:MAG: agmatine deiminase [archaeon]